MGWSREEGIVGESPVMRALEERVQRVAQSDLPLLVRGETGSGKEVVARAVHGRSRRRAQPFVSESCAALPETLLEAELFGHEQGAFTGATRAAEGLFRRASGGTLFVDEVADMSPALQAKLLRVLQTGEVRPVGGSAAVRVDVRVVASTRHDLPRLVEAGRFRQDLYFRLAVLELEVPPLRERLEDLPALAHSILLAVARERGEEPLPLTEGALDVLLSYGWPGNVRELENVLRSAALFAGGGRLEASLFRILSRSPSPAEAEEDAGLCYQELREQLAERERRYVLAALRRADGNKAKAARRLGITRYALYRTLRRLGLDGEATRAGVEPETEVSLPRERRRTGSGSERLKPVAV
ncbi:MAG: sigma-54-dependent Fis family transcriptional regulator [Planctomycetota bacterium]|nr:MAG: sigma-54-dependent Fis family transcriptional regulator [Planctomycetota bacterium]